MNEWIKITNGIPLFGPTNCCLFFTGKKEVTYGYAYDPKEGFSTEGDTIVWIHDMGRDTNEVATHWMSLPGAPK